MIFRRHFTILALIAATSSAAPGASFAQSLSDASARYESGSANGYMGLGGNLGKAMVARGQKKSARTAARKSVKQAHVVRNVAQRNRLVGAAAYVDDKDAPIFLIARGLDQTGLNINAARAITRIR